MKDQIGVCVCVCACVRACVRACLHACVRACVIFDCIVLPCGYNPLHLLLRNSLCLYYFTLQHQRISDWNEYLSLPW